MSEASESVVNTSFQREQHWKKQCSSTKGGDEHIASVAPLEPNLLVRKGIDFNWVFPSLIRTKIYSLTSRCVRQYGYEQMSLSSKQWLPSGSADLSALSGGLCIPSFQSALVPGNKDLESTFEHRTIVRVFQDNRFNDSLIILEHCLLYPIHHDKPC